jgi:hypothetical protein
MPGQKAIAIGSAPGVEFPEISGDNLVESIFPTRRIDRFISHGSPIALLVSETRCAILPRITAIFRERK